MQLRDTGGIQLYGVAGNIEQAADKLMDIIATKIEAAGNGRMMID